MGNLKEFFQYIFGSFKFWVIIQPWEQGLIVRKGNTIRKVEKGWYFRIPYIDSVYVQEIRTRSLLICIQTITTKDGHTLTVNSQVEYSITDIERLYQTLFHPEATISNMTMSELAEYIFTNNLNNITPKEAQKFVFEKLSALDFGIKFEKYRITNFANVKTFRLIQDGQSWNYNDVDMNKKK